MVAFFDAFSTDGEDWTLGERTFAGAALDAAQQMAADMLGDGPGWCLSLLGQTSAGKTMLAKRLLKWWNTAVPPKRYRSGGDARFHVGTFVDWCSRDWAMLRDERDAPMMVLDEIGRGERGSRGADWESLREILSFRLNRNVWTVITANLTFNEIRAIDPAIASRLRREGGVVLQAGVDVRPYEDRRGA